MTDFPMKAPKRTLISGILTFFLIVVMFVLGGNPKPAEFPNEFGFTAAIYWLEVTESPAELFRVLGDPATETGRDLRAGMDSVNRVDFAFMAAYSLFMALLALMLQGLLLHRDGPVPAVRAFVLAALAMSIVMFLGDIMENIQLLKLTKFQASGDVDGDVISSLMMFTRFKWFAIFLGSLMLASLYILWFRKRIPAALFALLFGASGIIGFISFLAPGMKALLELSSNLLGAAWLAATIHAGVVVSGRKD